MFTVKHLIILAICLILFIVGLLFINKINLKQAFKIMLYIGIVSEVIKVFYYIITNEAEFGGYLPKTDLPFHLCSIQILFVLFINLSKNEKVKKIIMSFMIPTCLVGGFFALLIPTSSSINGLWILTLQYFGYHLSIMLLAVKIMKNEEIKFDIKDYKNCLIIFK